ncbi:zinc-dependent peptidase [Marinagarivorans algicola]|uniref:zinc-dependent peptidase n=1 Tax=Marinagarivorans algicola TaxID=1513270 RepID=UPI0006B9F060|nr:zinc-dependent peptidase [Marinagarivorans algicola]
MWRSLWQKIASFLGLSSKPTTMQWHSDWSDYLHNNVDFYRTLKDCDKKIFEHRVLLFLQTTRVEGGGLTVTNEDCLLVAASAIIPVWAYPKWHYFNLVSVYLLPQAFNANLEFNQPDSCITGMVGTGVMAGKLVLSRPDLHAGFANAQDKQNVGIHEFVHLIDMADGECDGFPERLKAHAFSTPWFELVKIKVEEIIQGTSNIPDYGATNRAEFFAVASEYFFERPKLLKEKHPQVYAALSAFYAQDTAAIEQAIKPYKNAPCLCGSGRKYKRCCMSTDQ